MIHFAVPPIGGKGWFGGWMYMRNLVRALAAYGDPAITTSLFVGPDRADDEYIQSVRGLPRTHVIVDPAFNEDRVRAGIARTLLTGRNAPLLDAFHRAAIDVALTPAIYLGWRSEISSIAWIPDFQHRRLPDMFGRAAWWKRDIGFRAQVASSAAILLSSNDAESDCLEFYPGAAGKTCVARFSVPLSGWPSADEAWKILRAAAVPEDFVFLPNQLWLHKNHVAAIHAAAELKARGSSRCIVVTGHGNDPRRPLYKAELNAMVEQLDVASHFRLMGSVEHRLVQAMMIGANALLNPSRFEGWSTTVEEAKACGTPLLLSNIGVHREQAPGARFFEPDSVGKMVEAIEAAAPRSLEAIAEAVAAARGPAADRQRVFAQTISKAVEAAARR